MGSGALDMPIWKISQKKPIKVRNTTLETEKLLEDRLEDWIVEDSSILGEPLLLIGRQVSIPEVNDRLDLLALDVQGNTMYTGVVKNGEKTLVPYAHNVTIEETKSRNDSIARYNAYVAQAEQQGYTGSQQEQGMWYGKIGTGENPPQEVWIHINEPQWWGLLLQGSKVEIDMSHNQYTVAVDYMTQA
jgi:hypothetical protein